jgi:hypothetical protein
MRLHESHEPPEDGFGVSNNTITRHAASYTTNVRFVVFLGTFARPAQQVWLPGNNLQDPSSLVALRVVLQSCWILVADSVGAVVEVHALPRARAPAPARPRALTLNACVQLTQQRRHKFAIAWPDEAVRSLTCVGKGHDNSVSVTLTSIFGAMSVIPPLHAHTLARGPLAVVRLHRAVGSGTACVAVRADGCAAANAGAHPQPHAGSQNNCNSKLLLPQLEHIHLAFKLSQVSPS